MKASWLRPVFASKDVSPKVADVKSNMLAATRHNVIGYIDNSEVDGSANAIYRTP